MNAPRQQTALAIFLTAVAALAIYRFILPIPYASPFHLSIKHLFIILAGLSLFLYIFAFRWDRLKNLVTNFFSASSHPMNLAIFRIAFFAFILGTLNLKEVLFFSRFPRDLMYPPVETGWISHIVPINEGWAMHAAILLTIFCWMGLLGILTRFSCLMSTLLIIYTLGIPQMFGKVVHYHNLCWFDLILAFSPCADMLSVDAILKTRHQNNTGNTIPSNFYGLPIRIIWFLFGLVYVGPGAWKIWNDAAGWAMGDSLRNHLFDNWMNFDGWTPALRIDHYPFLCHISGLFTLCFEFGFIFLIFFPRLRWLAITSGLIFHTMIWYLMRISFLHLQYFYLVFVSWDKILHRIGTGLFPQEMAIFYDGNCGLCRRTIASLKTMDVFGRIRYLNALETSSQDELKKTGISQEAALADMHAVTGTHIDKGYDTYRALAFRIPALWTVLPLMFLWPVPAIGRAIYRRIADSRGCDIAAPRPASLNLKTLVPSRGLIVASVILVSSSFCCDLFNIDAAWPMALYPPFAYTPSTKYETVQYEITTADGQTVDLKNRDIKGTFRSDRFVGLVGKILDEAPAEQQKKFKDLWIIITREHPELLSSRSVKCYKLIETTIPDERNRNPLSRELIYASSTT